MYQLATGWEIWERCQEPQSLGKRPIIVGKIPMVLLKSPFFFLQFQFYQHQYGDFTIMLVMLPFLLVILPWFQLNLFFAIPNSIRFYWSNPLFFLWGFKSLSIFSIPIFLLVEIVTVFFSGIPMVSRSLQVSIGSFLFSPA